MAELMVKIQYASKVRSSTLALLRLTFPIWGVVAPIAAVAGLVALITTLHSTYYQTDFYAKTIGIILAGLALPGLMLLITRALSNDCIIADKNGLLMPFSLTSVRRYWPWENIRTATVKGSAAKMRAQTLALTTDKGKTVNLKLGNLQQPEIEQLLLALEVWAPKCTKDPSVLTLQQELKQIAPAAAEMSYTNMWEEELRRRFCATSFMPLEPGFGLRNGTLRVIRQLALGGLSALYLCQLEDKKLVVIKEAVVPEDSADNVQEKAREMFEREAQLLMKLNHTNIVKVLDCFTDSGRNYMMLEYVNGQDIRQFVKQNGPQKEHVVVEWGIQIANILKHLHEQEPPIIHRDLTPDNLVLREDGQIVLIDFGAANEFIGTATGTFVGKQSFIAPEQFRGKAVTQSDIYAFGCTLHFLLTGEEPEALASSSPREFNDMISEDMNEIVECCTQMEVRDRFQSSAQLLRALRKVAASSLVS